VFRQNLILLVASYFFYVWWDWRFLFLISSFTDYIAGLQIEKSSQIKIRKAWLWTSVIINVGLLGFFKYYNFFVDSLITSFELLDINIRVETLNIILPIGISFYTFQTLAYTIDVYRSKIRAEKAP
jgi:D-alanyl-lipoteichoic acid acyltransferase DltB (MBOAT superfamily)